MRIWPCFLFCRSGKWSDPWLEYNPNRAFCDLLHPFPIQTGNSQLSNFVRFEVKPKAATALKLNLLDCSVPPATPTMPLDWPSCHLKVIADVNFIDAHHCARLYSPLLENTRLLFQRAVSNTLVMFKPAVPGCSWTAQHHSRCCFFFFFRLCLLVFKEGAPNNMQ